VAEHDYLRGVDGRVLPEHVDGSDGVMDVLVARRRYRRFSPVRSPSSAPSSS
jgi:hypothetical protein